MAKTEETKKTPKETKAKTNKTTTPAKKAPAKKSTSEASAVKKPAVKKAAKIEKKPKQTNQTKPLTAADGWKEKKAELRKRSREPKTLAERRAYQDKGPIRLFFMRHKGIWDFLLVPVFTFALLCLYSIASGNEMEAAVWCVNMSRHLFGGICFLFYVWVAVFCIRFWLRNFERFKVMHFGRYFYFLGLYFFVALVLQYNANKSIPVIPPEEAGGVIADTVVKMVTNVLGNSGMLILLIFLMLFFIWAAWRFLAAREREQNNKDEVPVRVYWDVHTAAEAEALEAEKQKAEALTSDIEADFRSTMGLLTASEGKKQPKDKPSIREEAGRSWRKIREAFQEIAQPIPDKEAMIPKAEPETRNNAVPEEPLWEGLQKNPKPVQSVQPRESTAVKRTPKKVSKPKPQQLPLKPTAPELLPEEEELPPEPVFEEQEDHNGSGLLSAPAEPVTPALKEETEPPVQVRSRSVTINEAEEHVETTVHDYSFVPTIPPEETGSPENGGQTPEDPWIMPDVETILDPVKQYKGASPDDPAIKNQAEKIERLLDTFGAPSSVVDIQCGPTFSQFGVEPGFIERGGRKTRVRIKQIEMLQKDLEMELSVKQLAIEAPIPGKTYVGIQVQNKSRIPVSLREVIESEDFRSHKRELGIALGKDINGATFGADLTRMPHLLIAGATGSGKSVCLNAILACLLLHNSPDQLKLVLVDPKRVELTGYNGIPHLITPVVTDIEQVGNVLQWVLREMDMRNLHFMENGVRNIQEYNRKFTNRKLPYIVVVIDELANLMMEAASDIENSIVRLAQTARAMGIHLIVATQRPSRDVITGTIKGNLPTRIAFAVASYVDSQVILDRPGAENLFGKGDMYFLSTEETSLKRLQCVYVSDDEIRRIVSYWQKKPRIDDETGGDPDLVNVPGPVTEKVVREPEITSTGTLTQLPLFNEAAPQLKKDGDVLYDEAVKMVQRAGRASANMLVSRLSIGYSRANKLLARMEEEGIIGPPNPNPAIPREILDYGEYGPENDSEE
ncbi:MAG: DNA translocase FtsK 4TM domain-containing protein [Anaerolineaceae bacterium]|nr:DNA translocase FtsK 4TM domain-containing protein [Anaerolineaceae bacterium]